MTITKAKSKECLQDWEYAKASWKITLFQRKLTLLYKSILSVKYLQNFVDLLKMQVMNTEVFIAVIRNIYITLEQLHPFPDGNSRTIREFTRSLAKEARFEIHWNTSQKLRMILIAFIWHTICP